MRWGGKVPCSRVMNETDHLTYLATECICECPMAALLHGLHAALLHAIGEEDEDDGTLT
jgi:hypothetical protein